MRLLLPLLLVATALAAPDRDALRDQGARFATLDDRYQELLGQRAALKQEVERLDAELRELLAHGAPDPGTARRLAEAHEAAQAAYAEFERPSSALWKARVELEAAALKLEADLDAALEEADDPELRLWRGELLARLGRYAAARPDAEAAAFARPEDPRALRLLGRCAATQNRFADAEGLFGEAVRRAPSAEGWALLAVARYCANHFAQAREAWGNVDPAQVPPRLLRRCRALLDPEALRALEEAWTEEQRLRAEAPGPRIAFELEGAEVVLELFPSAAPQAVERVLARIRGGGLAEARVQRVLENLALVFGGSPRVDPAEQVEVDPALPRRRHFRGSVALERTGEAGYGPGLLVSLTPAPRLDARHLVIGRVVSGQRALDAAREGQRIAAARVLE